MIERLLLTLRSFADARASRAAGEEATRRTAADFLDAYRLIVDCPQYELGATARAALADVEDVAERLAVSVRRPSDADLEAASRSAARALAALGESPPAGTGAMVDGPQH